MGVTRSPESFSALCVGQAHPVHKEPCIWGSKTFSSVPFDSAGKSPREGERNEPLHLSSEVNKTASFLLIGLAQASHVATLFPGKLLKS